MKRFLPLVLALFLFLPGILFAQVPSIARLADNVPSDIAVGRGWHRALAFTPNDFEVAWAWGGKGATGDLSDELWQYNFDLDTWSRAGFALLPRDMEYIERTGSGFDRYLVAVGGTGGGSPIIDVYNTLLDVWDTDSTLGAGWTWGFTGTAARNGLYYLVQGADGRRLWSIDITNLAGGWTVLTPPPVSVGLIQSGVIVQDPLFPDRLVVFQSTTGDIHYYSIAGDSWTDLGNIYPPDIHPTIAFPVEDFGLVAGRFDTVDTIDLHVLNWDTSSFDSIGSWTDVNFEESRMPATSVAIGASGRTRIMFGAGYSGGASPPAGGEKFWGGDFLEPPAALTIESVIDGWVSFIGVGLAILFVAIVCGIILWLVKAPPLMMLICGWLSLLLLFTLGVVSPAIVLIALVAFVGAMFFKIILGSSESV